MLGEKRMKISILRAQNSSSYYLICVRGLRCIFHRCVHGRSSLRGKDSIYFYMDKYFSNADSSIKCNGMTKVMLVLHSGI